MLILLDTVDKVKSFVNDINKVSCNVMLKGNRYVVDAKSIMGVLSLDLSQPIELIADIENEVTDIVNKYKNI